MLIPIGALPIKKKILGVIHIGAHECEERQMYINHFNLTDKDIIWIEAIPDKVNFIKSINPNILIYNNCISDTDNKEISFMITNNYQSSSMLNLKTHKIAHPDVVEIRRIKLSTKTLNTFMKENSFKIDGYNFLNLDIQGAELMALKGASEVLPHIDYIYCEVNTEELYENCALMNEIDNYLSTYNFKRILTKMTGCGWGDAFYMKI
jgi:FkbM family methyltransferase